MASVRVVSVDRVAPPSPGPGVVPLSFFDTFWISLPPIQRLFLYRETSSLRFSSVVSSLKSSLSKTLLKFHPFAGKLTYLPSSVDVIIDCSSTDGVAFIEAESDGDIDRLVGEPIHDTKAFIDLVPELKLEELPIPVMAVQVTRFGDRGAALGVTMHHTVADGKGFWQFMDAWAATCRGGEAEAVSVPVHDRAVIRHSRGEEIARRFLKDYAPELPNDYDGSQKAFPGQKRSSSKRQFGGRVGVRPALVGCHGGCQCDCPRAGVEPTRNRRA